MDVAEEPNTAEDVLALPFDQYQRYRLIAEVVAHIFPDGPPAILDVGGWPGTLRRFLPGARIVVADLQGTMPDFVRASGTALPFRDGHFACVVSSDTFEHIPPDGRARFLGELMRVTRGPVILGAPFDSPEVRAAEEVLQELIRTKYPQSYGFIEEHRQYGLPDLAATRRGFESGGFATIALPSGYLPHWLTMIALYFTLQWRSPYEPLFARLNRYYNLRYYRADNRAPSYRSTIVALRRGGATLTALQQELVAPPDGDPAAHDWPQIAALLQAIELEARVAPAELMRRIDELERLVEERTAWAQSAVRQIVERDVLIRQLQAQLAEREALIRQMQALLAAKEAPFRDFVRRLIGKLRRRRARLEGGD